MNCLTTADFLCRFIHTCALGLLAWKKAPNFYLSRRVDYVSAFFTAALSHSAANSMPA